ncbi:BAG family molecular chaperone regulator 2 [Cannabis sativa]|uniref:BAG family molecular chaperone regulator 2 n=1 Tax=Cannabis sativa TaxID=3483 RepID=UPI0029CA208F|nr:BAG family molecular chaperone regulator 2 [Cannabis sativa]
MLSTPLYKLPNISFSLRNFNKQKKIIKREKRKVKAKMIKLRSTKKYFGRSSSKLSSKALKGGGGADSNNNSQKDLGANNNNTNIGEIKWELRPGGMLVQRRESGQSDGEGLITIRVSTVSQWHHISIESTSTFGELKMILSLVSGMEPREQRLLFKGKERDDKDYLHMVGVRDKDKVLLLQDPAIKEMKLLAQPITNNPCFTISV